MKVIEHLSELRKRIIYIALSLLLLFLICIFYSADILRFIISKHDLISISPLEIMLSEIKIALYASVMLSIPIFLYHLIRFVRPALKKKEKFAIWSIPFAFILFISGLIVGYIILIPTLKFLGGMSIDVGVKNLWNLDKYLTFVLNFCFGMGIIFELPIIMILLAKINIISSKSLNRYRPHYYVAMFILSAVITPTTDAVTMLIFAIPIVILFELSILIIRFF
jgi:sec-independent protein translocase protein TatC